ncbi:MAG: lipoprotein, partial [Bacteroidetes bacterium]|nr:lipoprotein [Bacteroidota bacterium]
MKKIFVYFATILLGLSACSKDFLETTSTSDVDEAIMFLNTDNALKAINGIHRLMYEAAAATGTST